MEETEVLLNEKKIIVGGEEITVKPYSWIDTFKMFKHLETVLKAIVGNIEALKAVANAPDNENALQGLIGILETVNKANEDGALVGAIQEMIAAGIRKPPEFVADLDIEDIIEAGKAVFNVNKSFFSRKLPFLNSKEEPEEQK